MKVMKRTKLCWIVATFMTMVLSFALGLGSMTSTSVKAADANIWMLEGAVFRAEEPLGLGFITQINKAYYDGLVTAHGEEKVTTGTLFVRQKDVDKAEIALDNTTFTKANFDTQLATLAEDKKFTYKEVGNSGFRNAESAETDGYYEFRGSIVNIKQLNVEKDYCARGYVAYPDGNGGTTYEYTDYVQANHSRSIETVALNGAATQSKLEPYAPRENSKTIFDGSSVEYLYGANGVSAKTYTQYTDTDAKVVSATSLSNIAANEYTGSAVEIALTAQLQTFVKLPSRYAAENATAYKKIGVWFAMSKESDVTVGNNNRIYMNANTSYITNTVVKMGTGFTFNEFHYVELTLPTVDSACWSSGYLRLWDINAGEAANCNELEKYKLYVGSVTYITEEEIIARESGILNGLTIDNYTQYSLSDRNTGTDRVFLESTSLEGGYTGPAVQFRPGSNKFMTISFPSGLKYLTNESSADGLYLTVWMAVKTHVADSTMAGALKLANGAGTLFDKGTTYALNSTYESGNNVQWDASGSLGFVKDTWYQLYIPLANVVANNTDGTMNMFKIDNEGYSANDQDNFRLLVGNIGVATQAQLNELKGETSGGEGGEGGSDVKLEDILKGLTAENYKQYELTDRNSDTDRVFLESTSLEGDYTGPAVQFRPGGKKTMTISFPSGLEYLTDAESADGLYFTVWVALQHTGDALTGDLKFEAGAGALFEKNTLKAVRNNTTITIGTGHIEWNRPDRTGTAQAGFEVNKWYQLYIPLANVVTANTAGSLNMFYVVNGSSAGNVQDVCKLLVGNIGVVSSLPNA